MAVSQGSTLLSSDMQSWYTRLNAVISKYGGGITQLTVPAANKTITVSDMNNIVNKFNSIKTDAYLGNDSSIYTAGYSTVSQGELIQVQKGTAILTTLTRLEAIRCRNDARYNQGNSNTVKSNTNSKTANQHTDSNSAKANGDNNSAKSNGDNKSANSHGNSNSAKGNGDSRSANRHGDTQSARHYDRCYVSSRYNTNQCYFWGQSACNNGNSNSQKSNGDNNSRDTNGNSNSAKSNGNNNASKSNGNNRTVNGNGDSNTRHQHDNTKSTNSNGTRIDIYNARTVV